MNPVDFLLYAFEHWLSILVWSVFFAVLLYFSVKKLAIGGLFDPIHLAYAFTFGTKYGLVFSLYFDGLISHYLFFMIILFGLFFYISLIYFSQKKQVSFNNFFNLLVPKSNSKFEFKLIFFIYTIISLYIISNIGFGFFADTNRFDNNKGFGAFVRITDVLGTFIIAYLSVLYYERYIEIGKNDVKQFFYYILLFIFIVFFVVLNGAKAAFIFALITIVLAIRVNGNRFKIGLIKGFILISIATSVAILGLYINIVNNNTSSVESKYIKGAPVVLEKFLGRIIANGNQSYMSLPNNVIDELETDNFFIRILSPIIGNSLMSKIVGYKSNDYSVGRQIILYYDPDMDVAGGPTSHFDLFSYVYLGLFNGVVFVFILGYILGSFNKILSSSKNTSIFQVALITTLWIRSMAVILSPETGLAYIIDIFIIFFLLRVSIYFLNISIKNQKKEVLCH